MSGGVFVRGISADDRDGESGSVGAEYLKDGDVAVLIFLSEEIGLEGGGVVDGGFDGVSVGVGVDDGGFIAGGGGRGGGAVEHEGSGEAGDDVHGFAVGDDGRGVEGGEGFIYLGEDGLLAEFEAGGIDGERAVDDDGEIGGEGGIGVGDFAVFIGVEEEGNGEISGRGDEAWLDGGGIGGKGVFAVDDAHGDEVADLDGVAADGLTGIGCDIDAGRAEDDVGDG